MLFVYKLDTVFLIIFFNIILLYKNYEAIKFQETVEYQPCKDIKKPFVGRFKLFQYYPICKSHRPDLFEDIQEKSPDKFCVNVTTGVPFYKTVISKKGDLNCDIALFQLIIICQTQIANLSQLIKKELENTFDGSIGDQIVKIVAQGNSSVSEMFQKFEIYSVGHRNINDLLNLITSRISEGKFEKIEFDPDRSSISLVTSKLKDPPPILYIPKKPEVSMESREFSSGDVMKLNVVKPEKSTNSGSTTLSISNIIVISVVVVAACIIIILLVLYCIYRLRKKDEGSYVLNKNMVLSSDKLRKNMIVISNSKEYFA